MSGTDNESTIGVRVSNAEIYRLLLDTNHRVGSVEQTIREVVLPDMVDQREALKSKAEKEALEGVATRVSALEIRVYSILAGLIAALIGAKELGIF